MKYRFEQCLQRGKIVCIPVDHLPPYSSTVVISGIVTSDPIVETKTICDARRASAPYCSAKMAVFAAAGIAAIVIMTPLMRGSEKTGEKR